MEFWEDERLGCINKFSVMCTVVSVDMIVITAKYEWKFHGSIVGVLVGLSIYRSDKSHGKLVCFP